MIVSQNISAVSAMPDSLFEACLSGRQGGRTDAIAIGSGGCFMRQLSNLDSSIAHSLSTEQASSQSGMMYSTHYSNSAKNSAGVKIGMPSNGCKINKSGSRLKITSASPSIARFRNLSSVSSLHTFTLDFVSISFPFLPKALKIANLSSGKIYLWNLGLLNTSSNSRIDSTDNYGVKLVSANKNALREVPSFFNAALTTTPVSMTTFFNYEISSSSPSISSSLSWLDKTRLSITSNNSLNETDFELTKVAASNAAFIFSEGERAFNMLATLSGTSKVTVCIFLLSKNNALRAKMMKRFSSRHSGFSTQKKIPESPLGRTSGLDSGIARTLSTSQASSQTGMTVLKFISYRLLISKWVSKCIWKCSELIFEYLFGALLRQFDKLLFDRSFTLFTRNLNDSTHSSNYLRLFKSSNIV